MSCRCSTVYARLDPRHVSQFKSWPRGLEFISTDNLTSGGAVWGSSRLELAWGPSSTPNPINTFMIVILQPLRDLNRRWKLGNRYLSSRCYKLLFASTSEVNSQLFAKARRKDIWKFGAFLTLKTQKLKKWVLNLQDKNSIVVEQVCEKKLSQIFLQELRSLF